MDNIFVINPSVTALDLRNAVSERLIKARSITAYLLNDDNYKLNYSLSYGAILAINDYLSEIECIEDELVKKLS